MIKVIRYDKKNQKMEFTSDMDFGLANAVRRSVLEIPIMAIDEIEVVKNDSALYDEIIAHRVGLVPIKTEKGNKEVKFKLKEAGPKTVCSIDIKPSIGIDKEIPIVILDKDQEIELVCFGRMGKGIEHIKYSPGLMFYSYNLEPEIINFVHVKNGTINYDEEELKNSGLSEEKIKIIKSIKNVQEIIFHIESWGQIDVKEIFVKAIEALEENLKDLNKATK